MLVHSYSYEWLATNCDGLNLRKVLDTELQSKVPAQVIPWLSCYAIATVVSVAALFSKARCSETKSGAEEQSLSWTTKNSRTEL